MSRELPENDGAPVRVRLLGEDLIAFRDTDGNVGLVDAFCPHRRAPMFFGRNEECGLRCVYHGWKFDRDGTCVDMPSEPPDSLFKTKVTIKAYPTWEGGDIDLDLHGPAGAAAAAARLRMGARARDAPLRLQDVRGVQLPAGARRRARHRALVVRAQREARRHELVRNRDGAPRLEVEQTDYGYSYASTRDLGDDGNYVRVYHYVMPAQQMRGGVTSWTGIAKADVPRLDGHIWVPIDDETHVGLQHGLELRRERADHAGVVRRRTKRAAAAATTI